MGNPVGVKSVMRSTVSKYEQEQKEKFIQVMSDPRMRYSDALNFVETRLSSRSVWVHSIIRSCVL